MKTKYHKEITGKALFDHFSHQALQEVIQGNVRQDRLRNQIGRDYIHFDGSAFIEGFEYLSQQKQAVIDGIRENEYSSARHSLGRVTHSWQDFYSHSNYVKLWLASARILPPEEIVINDSDIINHPELKSGTNYGLIDFLALIPGISKLIKPTMPADSHAIMNLDGPESGDLFIYTYTAAMKQTTEIFNNLLSKCKRKGISQEKVRAFQDK